jgi:hypothetical protein
MNYQTICTCKTLHLHSERELILHYELCSVNRAMNTDDGAPGSSDLYKMCDMLDIQKCSLYG